MAFSTATIEFKEDLQVGDVIQLGCNFGYIRGDWVNLRQGIFQVTKGNPTSNPGERSAINFMQALVLDFPTYPLTYSVNNNILTIESHESWFGFINPPENYNNFQKPSSVNLEITTLDLEDVFSIENIFFSESDINPCQYVKCIVETNYTASGFEIAGQEIDPNSDNPVTVEILRGQAFSVKAYTEGGQERTINFNSGIDILNSDNLQINIQSTPGGSNIEIILNDDEENIFNQWESNIVEGRDSIDLQYSLDGIAWRNFNTFTSIPEGEYTVYVRDQFGCQTSKTFTVEENGINSPFFKLSKLNAIRYANRITWGDSANYKTDENTLSCEVDVPKPYKEIQLFHSADIVPTQFKSNFSNHEVKVINTITGTEMIIPLIEQFTENIGRKDRRDARRYNLENGKTGIYFLAGNTYDYSTGQQNGDYALNGYLPEWAVEGNYINVDNIWYVIEQTFYDESKEAEVIQIGNSYTGQDQIVQVSSVYNRENYEVFEFRIDMVNFLDQKIQVQIQATDDNFQTITHLSEVIWVKVKHENTLAIDYKNKNNNDIFYSTGIQFTLRPNIEKISGTIDQETEVNKGDTSIDLITANSYDTDVFRFQPMTKEMWKKVLYASLHSDVKYNGVSRVFKEAEVEGPLEETNIYILTITVSKSGSVYDSGSGNLEFATGDIEIPGLIETETGFVHY